MTRKYYSEPELEIKKYALAQSSFITTSDPGDIDPDPDNNGNDLHDKDPYDYFGG